MGEANGAYRELQEFQEERFNNLTGVLAEGFRVLEKKLDILNGTMNDQLTTLVKTLIDSANEKNHVPLDVARTMLIAQQQTYDNVVKGQQVIYKWYFRMLCWTFGVTLVAVTGVRIVFPHWFNG